MATSISSIGVGSGLPLDTLLEQLRLAENAPLAALQARSTKEQQRLTAYGTLKSAIESVSKAAEALGKADTFHAVKATVTGETFTATTKAGSGAIAGNHAISVTHLATAQVLASGRATASNQPLVDNPGGMIDLQFTLGEGPDATVRTLSVDAGSSLQDIAKAINNDSELGFSATLMNDGVGHRLVISANETGEDSNITQIAVVHGADGEGDLTELQKVLSYTKGSVDPNGMSESVAGRNAEITINGIQVISQSNTIEDAIAGITLTLNKKTAENAQPDTLQVARDDEVTTKAVDDFVKAYNNLQSTIKSLTAYNIDTQSGAALTGDSLARRAQTEMRRAINDLAANGQTLTTIGIKTDPITGNLSVDNIKLTEALKNNRADIQELFSGENGLSTSVVAAAEVFTKSDGLIKTSQDGINETIRSLRRQYEDMELRIDQKMETYRKQFVQLDGFVAQMGGISSYLSQQLAMLGNLSNSGKK